MKIYRDLNNFPNKIPKIISVGNFDGIHKGHRQIIKKVIQSAKEINGDSVIFTFDPHPRKVLESQKEEVNFLTPIEEKIEIFQELELDYLILFPFTKEFSKITAEEFINNILVKQIGISKIILGFDHFFGKNRDGSIKQLENSSIKHGFKIESVPAITNQGKKISSTIIRELLLEGNVAQANAYLEYNYSFQGNVISGYQIGRKIGFPTANLLLNNPHKFIPKDGIYVVKIFVDNVWMGGMMNIGYNPTLSNLSEKSIEIHIFGLNKKIYKKSLRIEFIERLRSEKQFDNVDMLKEQLHIDKEQSLKILEKNK